MHSNDFARVFDAQIARSMDVLKAKGSEYATDDDVLHNFKSAAGLNNVQEGEALWGMITKHIVSLSDMVKLDPNTFDMAVWDEKITDSINFLILLKAIAVEAHWNSQPAQAKLIDINEETHTA